MTTFQPELANLSVKERYGQLLAQAETARKLKRLPTETNASAWRLPTMLHLPAWLTGWLWHGSAPLHFANRASE